MPKLTLSARYLVASLLLFAAFVFALALPVLDGFGWRGLGTVSLGLGVLLIACLFWREARQVLSAAIVLLALGLASPASAASIEIGQALSGSLQEIINAVVTAAIAGLAGWVLMIVKDKFKVDIEAKHRDALIAFLCRQASSLIAQGAVKVQGLKVEVSNQALADAANMALHSIPDAMKFFGLTPESLRQRIIDMIPSQPAVAQAQAVAIDVANPATPSSSS
jgi:prepilin signal peptidase PulO-like enzyme (type II secretory pathway)